jgi:hypothetical protein
MNKEELEKYIEKDFLPSLLSKFPNIPDLEAKNARLKAEVERLRKAGDDMASSIQFNEEMGKDYDGPTIVHPSVERWNAAKEGKV